MRNKDMLYICFREVDGIKKEFQYDTLSALKKYSIKMFLTGGFMKWTEAKKHGWKCERANVILEFNIQ